MAFRELPRPEPRSTAASWYAARIRSASSASASRASPDLRPPGDAPAPRSLQTAPLTKPLAGLCAARRAALKFFGNDRPDLWPWPDRESLASAPVLRRVALRRAAWARHTTRHGAHRPWICRETARCRSAFHRAARRLKKYRRAHRRDRRALVPGPRKWPCRRARRP